MATRWQALVSLTQMIALAGVGISGTVSEELRTPVVLVSATFSVIRQRALLRRRFPRWAWDEPTRGIRILGATPERMVPSS